MAPDWANGAKILVEGLTHDLMKESVDEFAPDDLCQWHVVMLPEHETEINKALRTLTYRMRPRPKTRQTVMIQDKAMANDQSTVDGVGLCKIEELQEGSTD